MDFVVFSHLRWDFVFQRPQHLLSRAAAQGRVLYIEEEVREEGPTRIDLSTPEPNITVARPVIPPALQQGAAEEAIRALANRLVGEWRCGEYHLWHYSVMAEPISRDLEPVVTVFDCMDDLAAFRFAPPQLLDREARLMRRADVVFTGGRTLYETKRRLHPNVHAFPSSVDVAHFARARAEIQEPSELRPIGHPRLVYAGVIDERLDLGLIQRLADAGLGQVVLIGPVAKLSPDELPRSRALHYLGQQPYNRLPAFFGHSEVGIMPFALNDATRSISPTKTPEYLAAGLPVVSTPIGDVVSGYGDLPVVHIASATDFASACLDASNGPRTDAAADARLRGTSWDSTWEQMSELITWGRRASQPPPQGAERVEPVPAVASAS
jgi:hypothetical protein